MKKIAVSLFLLLFSGVSVYALEFEFIAEDKTAVTTAHYQQITADYYKQILIKRARLARKKREQDIMLKHLQGKNIATISDYSYRYAKKSIQRRALSCEISAASDILASLTKKQVSEDYLLTQLHKSAYNELPQKAEGKIIWGNPQVGFVGNIDTTKEGAKASQWNMTGYGVLEQPIVKIFEDFGLKTKTITVADHYDGYTPEKHLVEVLKSLQAGNAVQLWGDYCTTPAYEDSDEKNTCVSLDEDRTRTWYYQDKNRKLIRHDGLAGEHAFYLLGFTGNIENAEEIIVWDTMTGKHTYKKNEWMRKWKMMQYRSIIVYKND